MQAIQELGAEVPAPAVQLLLVLALGLLIGLEREGHEDHRKLGSFGGVRTFPLIGLLGYGLALISHESLLPVATGLGAVVLLLAIALQRKLLAAETAGTSAGITSEVSALVVYLIGVLAERGLLWIAATLAVACLLLLELKAGLEHLTRVFPGNEVLILAKFLGLSVVILPLLPNQEMGRFAINPFKTWLVVVAVTGISYGSYLLQRFLPAAGSVRLTALLGGAYSSTLVSVALARKSRDIGRPGLIAGSILMAAGVMYLRIALLVSLFSQELMRVVAWPFVALGAVALGGGWLWSHRGDSRDAPAPGKARNPLELSAAFLFAVLFMALMVVTKLVLGAFGKVGLLALAALMGVTDVDPFILGVVQGTGAHIALPLAAAAIVVAAASNNLVKGVYGLSLADRATGGQTFTLLGGLSVLGLAPLVWLH